MKNEPKVTVVMLSYNHADIISEAIESVLCQKTVFPYVLLISDNASTDGSIDIIRDYEHRYPEKIKAVYRTENIGHDKNTFSTLACIRTPYFCSLDADDYYTDDRFLQKAVDFLDAHGDYTVYSANVRVLLGHGESYLFIKSKEKEIDNTFEDYLKLKAISPQNTGLFFRNVVFIHGLPKAMEAVMGTRAESCVTGDAFRYVLHLHYGKSHFVNEEAGVYRVTGDGVWTGLGDFERCVAQANFFLSMERFFTDACCGSFIHAAWKNLQLAMKSLQKGDCNAADHVSAKVKDTFLYCWEVCSKSKKLLDQFDELSLSNRSLIRKVKYRLIRRLYLYTRARLARKNLLPM